LGGVAVEGSGRHRLFDQLVSTPNLFLAWDRFVRGKRSKPDVQAFERHLEDNLFALQEQLRQGTYTHDPYQAFVIHDPKRRQIHKSTVKDRVVHQAMINVIEPYFERRFIFYSYSSRKGKGTHAAIRRLERMLQRLSRNNTQTVYVLKMDIARFFATVDHEILLDQLGQLVTDERMIGLLRLIIGSFQATHGKGIPLGNVTSQLFANVYLNPLDQFVKHELRPRLYLRFCDDFVCVAFNRDDFRPFIFRVDSFLRKHLKLRRHSGKTICRTHRQGIDFLGYVMKPNVILLRTKTRRRAFGRVDSKNLCSYLAYFAHAKSRGAQQELVNRVWING
jgi:hypothetical protein